MATENEPLWQKRVSRMRETEVFLVYLNEATLDQVRRFVRKVGDDEKATFRVKASTLGTYVCRGRYPNLKAAPRGKAFPKADKSDDAPKAPVAGSQVDRPHVDEYQRHSDDYGQDMPNYDD